MNRNDDILDARRSSLRPEDYLATTGSRLINLIIDTIILYLLVVFLVIMMGAMLFNDDIMFTLFFYLVMVVYYTFFEALTGKTPAKWLTRTKVVTYFGQRPSFADILRRSLCRLIPFESLSYLGKQPVGWHDSIPKTYVVSDDYQPDEYL